ncbi:BRISC and BRCA1-A complex member 2-like [Amphiura filiformis]|uniref:BRISC and BRCA1-A complex member 2-like n=1 Tax=Amphiura filiformis TaxID=82378 RepID=UPI003B221155
MDDETILEAFDPEIAKFVEVLLKNGNVGVFGGSIRVLEPKTGQYIISQKGCCDRFRVQVPFAGSTLTWQVIFNSVFPENPPDFMFGPQERTFIPELENVKSLVNWDASNRDCLLVVIKELIHLYKEFQENLLRNYSRMQFEYTSLLELDTGKFNDVELLLARKGVRDTSVNFLIKLPVDFSEIPEFLTKDNPGEDLAVLLVSFQNVESNKALPQLYLSPRVEHALGGSASLRIPAFPTGGCLMDYVPNVCELLENMVDQLVKGYQKRSEYIAAFLSHFGRSVLEYDVESFSKISIMFEMQDFYFTMHITLPAYFPRDQPEFMFQSIYHTGTHSKPYTAIVKDYPYSPRWSGNEMAERARIYLNEYIPEFKRASVSQIRVR